VYPVNPKYDELEGIPCYPSLEAIGKPVDLAIIVLNVDGTLQALRDCAAIGVKAVVLPTQGFAEMGEDGRRKEQELLRIAREGGIRVVGTNTDGLANLSTGAVVSIQPLFEERIPVGPVGVVTHSGATAASLLVRLKDAGLGAKLHVSAGNETDLGLADYLSVMVQDPDIKIVLCFVESVRRPQDFYRVAELAAELGKPIALIKVGRSEEGARRASAHTGALAGADDLYDAVFEEFGVIRVDELSELVAVAKLFLGVGQISGDGVGILSGSGGQCGVAADAAKNAGVVVPRLRAEIEADIDALLTFGAGFNPCDLTGEIARSPGLAAEVYNHFSRDEQIGVVLFIRKKMLADVSERSVRPLIEAAQQPGATPLAIYAMDGFVEGVEAEIYHATGTPVFRSLHEFNVAVRGLLRRDAALRRRRRRPRPRVTQPLPVQLPSSAVLDEQGSRLLLAAYDVPMPQDVFAADPAAAARAAEEIGFPVVIKISDPRILHKTEIGGVVMGVTSFAMAEQAASDVLERGRVALDGQPAAGVVVQEQVVGGIELIAGLKVDPAFGPFVLLGLGGVTAELMDDVAVRRAPVTPEEVLEMISELRCAPLLGGFRGAPPRDVEALAAAVSRLSELGADGAEQLAEADINPLAVLEQGKGVRALDSLFLGRERSDG
jgi:acetyltransferase